MQKDVEGNLQNQGKVQQCIQLEQGKTNCSKNGTLWTCLSKISIVKPENFKEIN